MLFKCQTNAKGLSSVNLIGDLGFTNMTGQTVTGFVVTEVPQSINNYRKEFENEHCLASNWLTCTLKRAIVLWQMVLLRLRTVKTIFTILLEPDTDNKFWFQHFYFSHSLYHSHICEFPRCLPASVCPQLCILQSINFPSLLLSSMRRPVAVVPGPCAPVAWVGHQGVQPVRHWHGDVSKHGRQRAVQDEQGRLPAAHHHVQCRSASLSSQLPQGK